MKKSTILNLRRRNVADFGILGVITWQTLTSTFLFELEMLILNRWPGGGENDRVLLDGRIWGG